MKKFLSYFLIGLIMLFCAIANAKSEDLSVKYDFEKVEGINIFYREAGNPNKPNLS